MSTGIEYLDETWNVFTGCTRVSEGCAHCYARLMARRLKAMGVARYQHADPFTPRFHLDQLDKPLHWRKPRIVGVGFMADMFHHDIPDAAIFETFSAMIRAYHHTYVLLTKRPERMLELCSAGPDRPNWWLGVTAENQECFDQRIKPLLTLAAAGWNTWVSFEPLLGPIEGVRVFSWVRWQTRRWAVVGCESGPGRRPMDPLWARDIAQECQAQQVPVYVKQVEVAGRVSHDPAQWPKVLRVRQTPWGEKP